MKYRKSGLRLRNEPSLHFLSQRKRKSWDEMRGNLSYGVFLNYMLLIWLLKRFPLFDPVEHISMFLLMCLVAIAFSYALVEMPVIAHRRSLRKLEPGLL